MTPEPNGPDDDPPFKDMKARFPAGVTPIGKGGVKSHGHAEIKLELRPWEANIWMGYGHVSRRTSCSVPMSVS